MEQIVRRIFGRLLGAKSLLDLRRSRIALVSSAYPLWRCVELSALKIDGVANVIQTGGFQPSGYVMEHLTIHYVGLVKTYCIIEQQDGVTNHFIKKTDGGTNVNEKPDGTNQVTEQQDGGINNVIKQQYDGTDNIVEQH
uniref:Uncharacterized protein n=1 Tax=Timema monikensis TaxID=170555 RepID=A0A7R9EEU6_9NEOP|nr:unnamed protein product [Timema monikensis]